MMNGFMCNMMTFMNHNFAYGSGGGPTPPPTYVPTYYIYGF